MKKIIVGLLSFVVLFTAQSVFAANWNSDSSDCQNTVAIANYTSNTGYGSCWTSTSMSAEPGDTINVRIYYHNTSNTVANNVRLAITKSSNSSTSHNFTGRIMSDNGDLSGNVNLSVSSSQSISFVDARWFPNQSRTLVSLPNGQSASSILSSGISIGNVDPGWESQGTMVAVFKVSNTVVPQLCTDTTASNYEEALPCTHPELQDCKIDAFTANPTSITSGGSSTLSWTTSNCTSASISPTIGNVNVDSAQSIWPTQTTTYTLTATGPKGTDQKNVTINVNQPANCTINSFTASPSSITSGYNTTLSWNTSDCTSVSISPTIRNVTTSGSTEITPPSTTTYTLTASGSTGAPRTQMVTVTVNQPSVIMTGSINAIGESCIISSGNSTCPMNFTWSTQNGEATSAVTHNGTTVANGNNGSQSFAISYGSQSYFLYNNSKLLDSDTVTATCASNTSWNGSYCASVIVNNCSINSFTANPTSITSGGSSTLSWDTDNCISVSISPAIGSVNTSGSRSVSPTQTKTYTLIASGSSGTPKTQTVTVYVNQPANCTINSFTASPSSITSGYNTTLSWNTSDCTSVSISPTIRNVTTSGSTEITPPSTTTYTLTASGSTGAPRTQMVTVTVNQRTLNCTINNFTASPTSITSGDSSILNWSTSNCTSVVISGLSYNVPVSGTQSVYPTQTKTYTLTAFSSTSPSQSRTATVYVNDVNDNNCSITDFSASDTSIEDGDSTTLRWNTNNCDRVRISSIGDVNEDGSKTVYPSDDTTYTLTAYNTDGSSETDTVRIYVDNNNNDNNDNNDCSIDSFTANDIYIDSGDSVTLRWSTSDCDNVNISNIGNVSLDGSRTIYPTYTTTYTLRAYGNSTDTRSIQINVNYNPVLPPIIPIYNSSVVTTVATNISQTGAQLNGLVTNSIYGNTNVYFQYGTTVNLGARTATHSVNGNSNFNEFVSNLSPNTIYFFQAFSEGTNGISRGAIEVFKTLGYATTNIQTIRQVVVQGTTVTSSESPIMLRIENKYQTIGIGDIVDYVVTYKNISSSRLTNPMVQVFIPEGITLLNTSRGTYSEDDRTLSVPIADLNPNDEGVIYLQARVDSMDANLAQIVTTTILIYTNPNGAQENAMAYVLNNPKVGNVLGASAFFGNIFGLSLIGWLIIIIFILLLTLVARSFYGHRNVVTTPTHTIIS